MYCDNQIKYAEKHSDDKVQICGVKGFVDGVTSTFTGYLLEPYSDRLDTCGDNMPIENFDSLAPKIAAANAAGFGVRLHCIGDAAVRMALDMYENSIKVNGNHGCVNVIEHIETINPEDIPRFKELGVIASMQPQHLPLDLFEKERRVGVERCKWEWPHKTMIDQGCTMAFGTDYPVVDFNPYPTLHAAVTRLDENNNPASVNSWECITLQEAIKAYTVGSAKVYCRENELGTLEEGKLADITVADRDLFTISPKELKDVETLMTMMDGKIVYEKHK